MCMLNSSGMLAIIPATLLLALSFFILFVLGKPEAKGLKAFGYIITALLWICVLLILRAGISKSPILRCPMMPYMTNSRMHAPMMHSPMMIPGYERTDNRQTTKK